MAGCTSLTAVNKETLYGKCETGAIESLTITTESRTITLDQATCQIKDDTLYLKGIRHSAQQTELQSIADTIAMADIKYVELKEYDSGKTLGCIIGASAIALGVFLLIAAISVGDSINNAFDCNKKS